MKPILQTAIPEDDAILRGVALPVPQEDFGTPALEAALREMTETLDAADDGVALAAPQIGIPYRIFIVRHDRILPPPPSGEGDHPYELGVFINPSITRTSQRRQEVDEGCLSVKHIYGKTRRYARATVHAQDASGKWFERGGGGVLAQAYQHEIDHLNGILFIDHATDMVEYRREPLDENHA